MKTRSGTRPVKAVTLCAVMVALASVLSIFLKFESPFPYGGSVTIGGMVPIILAAYILGPKWGMIASVTFSFIQIAVGIGQVAAWGLSAGVFIGCLLLDYIGAYSILAIASVFKDKKPWTIIPASVIACVCRFVLHALSGLLFFGTWAAEGFDALTWTIVYNGGYMLPELVINSAICAALIPLIPYLRKSIVT